MGVTELIVTGLGCMFQFFNLLSYMYQWISVMCMFFNVSEKWLSVKPRQNLQGQIISASKFSIDEGAKSTPSCFIMGTTNEDVVSMEQNLNPLCFECGQQHWTRENHLYNYQNDVDDDLVCHICLQPLLQPLDTPCGHTFCYKCLRNFLQEKDFCPLDRKRLYFKLCKKSSILVHKLLDKLLVLCPFSSVCEEVMQRCDLEAHLKNRWAARVMSWWIMKAKRGKKSLAGSG